MEIRTKTRLSLITFLLLIFSFRPRSLRKINIKEVIEEAIQPLKSMPPRYQRRTKIKPRI